MPPRLSALSNEDRLPHDKAVWRKFVGLSGRAPNGVVGKRVSVEYPDGQIVQDVSEEINWRGVVRWRFGWAPR